MKVVLIRKGTKSGKPAHAVVISPGEMNQHTGTVVVAPLTTRGGRYPTRIPVRFQQKSGQIVLDRIRTIDKSRLLRRLG